VKRLLPLLLPVPAVLAVVAVLRPGLLTSGAGSPVALATGVGVGLAGLLVLALLWRRTRAGALVAADVVVLALLAAVLWPAFRERTVVEAFSPVEEPAAVVVEDVTPLVPTPTATAAAPRAPVVSRAPEAPVAPVATVAPVAPVAPPSAAAVRASRGTFSGIGHRASGHAAIYRVGGTLRLRFEDISFQGTPSPSVHLVRAGARSTKGGITLGALKGEHGSFSYPVPAGFDLAKDWRVLVWCDRYDVPIAAADLT
jgi:hypothetical protein